MEANRKNSHSPSAEQDREGAVIYYLVPKKQGKFGVPKNVRHSAPRTPLFRSANCYGCSNSASSAPQNQLQLAECTCRKSCVVGCGVLRGLCT